MNKVTCFAVAQDGRVMGQQTLLPRLVAGAAALAAQQGLRLVKALGRTAQEVEKEAFRHASGLRQRDALEAKRAHQSRELRRVLGGGASNDLP